MARKDPGLPGFVGWIILLAVFAGPALGIGIPIWAAITEKSYEFPSVEIDATVLPDGSLELVEQRTFAFDGEFSFAFFTIDHRPELIEGFTVREGDRTYPVSTAGSSAFLFHGRWEFAARDESRTFTISYRALCAVDVWADTAHLNWQFIGTGTTEPTEHARVRVHLPPAVRNPNRIERPAGACPTAAEPRPYETRPLRDGETLAWGHGPLGGEVRIPDPQTVELEISDLPASTFVEGSIVFPETAVPLAPQIQAPMRESIVSTEELLARIANRERRALLAQEARRASWRRVFWVVLAALPLVLAMLVVISRLRDRVPGVPRMLQEPPQDIHPVDLAGLWATATGRVGTQHIYRAQMLHLTDVGAIELQAVGPVSDPEDFRVRLRDMKGLDERDVEFLEFVFPNASDDDIALSSLKPVGKRRTELRQWWKAVDSSGKRALRRVLPEIRWESVVTTLLGFGSVAAGLAFTGLLDSPLGLVLIPVGILGMAIAHVLIRPRIEGEGAELVARWRAFRRFLTEFSSLPETPALAVTIWERYLVYATALGVADEVEKQVKALIPPEELPRPWKGAPAGIHGYAHLHTFNSVPVHSAASVAPRSASTSSGIGSFSSGGGGGGGFSGGGGGGGGGTGAGAG